MTVKGLMASIGKRGLYRIHGMSFPVVIQDVRQVFNRVDFQIHPIGGTGESWVDASMVKTLESVMQEIKESLPPVIRRVEV